MPVPLNLRIFHIVHHDRLPNIIGDGGLRCDATMTNRPNTGTTIGMAEIKARRLHLPVSCHAETAVGDYVPFYLSPRSVMLYVIHRASQPDGSDELDYRDGQDPIVHLMADMRKVEAWATQNNVKWAYSLINASTNGAEFRDNLANLGDVDWDAVNARYWQDDRDAKQAEFLVHQFFPWELITGIGVKTVTTRDHVQAAIQHLDHKPRVLITPGWYY